jgi:hypothetical protein
MSRLYINNSNYSDSNQGLISITATSSQLLVTGNTRVFRFTYEIGDYLPSEGGIVYYRWLSGASQSYLIVDTSDISSGTVWSNVSTTIGSSAQSVWNGMSNSVAVINQVGHSTSAASLCLNSTNNGKNDWYLPSLKEFDLLLVNMFEVSRTLESIGATAFEPPNAYWTSTEYDFTNYAMYYRSRITDSFGNLKSLSYRVRAIRKLVI